jgi:pyridoxamine 5'-phosphate oxidase
MPTPTAPRPARSAADAPAVVPAPAAPPGTAPVQLATLAEIEAALWRELGRAALDRHHEWRTPVLATLDAEPADPAEPLWPDARTVVLREVLAERRELVVYSDARAAKLRQLQAAPRALLVMWSRRLGWQLRLRVQVQTHIDGLAATSRWLRLRATPSAHDYLSPLAPGTVLPDTTPPPAVPDEGAAPRGDAAAQRAHFAVLTVTVQSIDWLELHRAGHRRARFDAAGPRWLVP